MKATGARRRVGLGQGLAGTRPGDDEVLDRGHVADRLHGLGGPDAHVGVAMHQSRRQVADGADGQVVVAGDADGLAPHFGLVVEDGGAQGEGVVAGCAAAGERLDRQQATGRLGVAPGVGAKVAVGIEFPAQQFDQGSASARLPFRAVGQQRKQLAHADRGLGFAPSGVEQVGFELGQEPVQLALEGRALLLFGGGQRRVQVPPQFLGQSVPSGLDRQPQVVVWAVTDAVGELLEVLAQFAVEQVPHDETLRHADQALTGLHLEGLADRADGTDQDAAVLQVQFVAAARGRQQAEGETAEEKVVHRCWHEA